MRAFLLFVIVPVAQPAVPHVNSTSLGGTGTFHLQLTGDPQLWYRLESPGNLSTWSQLSTMLAPKAAFELSDVSAGSTTRKFYRVSVLAGQ